MKKSTQEEAQKFLQTMERIKDVSPNHWDRYAFDYAKEKSIQGTIDDTLSNPHLIKNLKNFYIDKFLKEETERAIKTYTEAANFLDPHLEEILKNREGLEKHNEAITRLISSFKRLLKEGDEKIGALFAKSVVDTLKLFKEAQGT